MKTIKLEDYQFDILLEILEEYKDIQWDKCCDDLNEQTLEKIKPYQEKISQEYAYFNNSKNPEGPDEITRAGMLTFWLTEKIKRNVVEEKS